MHSSWYRSSSSLPLITAYLSSRGRYMSKMLVLASWSPPLARRSICSNVISVHPLDVLLQLPDSPVIHRGRALIRQSQLHTDHIEWALVQHAGQEHIPFPLVQLFQGIQERTALNFLPEGQPLHHFLLQRLAHSKDRIRQGLLIAVRIKGLQIIPLGSSDCLD